MHSFISNSLSCSFFVFPAFSQFTFLIERCFLFMNIFQMNLHTSFSGKAFVTNITLERSLVFMKSIDMIFQHSPLNKSFGTHLTRKPFQRFNIFMKTVYMPCESSILTKCLCTQFAFKFLDVVMDNKNVISRFGFGLIFLSTLLTFM